MVYWFHIYSYCSLRMETSLIPQRAAGTRSPYTEEEIYYLTHPETWIAQTQPLPRRQNAVQVGVAEVEASLVSPLPRRQNAVVVAEVEVPLVLPLVLPLPRRQNAFQVGVAEVEAPHAPPLPRRQNAVQVGVAEVEAPHAPPLPRRQNAV
jgi:hypothetical protein